GGTLGGTDQGSGYLRFQLRQVPHDGRPDFLEVDAEVVVYENVPHRGYLGPGNVRMRASDLIRQASDRFANDLEVMKDPGLNQFVAIECRSATARILLDAFDRLQDVFEALPVPPQSGMASFRTRSRIRERSPRAMAMSTLRPRRASSSITSAAWSRRLRPGSRSTSRSTSLSAEASPRATDPKTRTLPAPWAFAARRILGRFSLRSSSIPMVATRGDC